MQLALILSFDEVVKVENVRGNCALPSLMEVIDVTVDGWIVELVFAIATPLSDKEIVEKLAETKKGLAGFAVSPLSRSP